MAVALSLAESRMCSMTGRTIGWQWATIASTSTAALGTYGILTQVRPALRRAEDNTPTNDAGPAADGEPKSINPTQVQGGPMSVVDVMTVDAWAAFASPDTYRRRPDAVHQRCAQPLTEIE